MSKFDEIKSDVKDFYHEHDDTINKVVIWGLYGAACVATMAGSYYCLYKACQAACDKAITSNVWRFDQINVLEN